MISQYVNCKPNEFPDPPIACPFCNPKKGADPYSVYVHDSPRLIYMKKSPGGYIMDPTARGVVCHCSNGHLFVHRTVT